MCGPQRRVNVQTRPRHLKIRTPSRHNYGEGSRRTRTDLRDAPFGGVEGGGTCTRTRVETGKGSSPRGEIPRNKVTDPSREAKDGEGESPADGVRSSDDAG